MLQSGTARDGGVIHIGLNYPVSESSVYLLFSTQGTDMRNTKPTRMTPHEKMSTDTPRSQLVSVVGLFVLDS